MVFKQLLRKGQTQTIMPTTKAKKFTNYKVSDKRFKAIYGDDFITKIPTNCEMANLWKKQEMSDNDIALNYFRGGFQTYNRLSEVIASLELGYHNIDSMLDFASGYGRTTRFFVQKMDPSKITVSDISKDAVIYQKQTFGVHGFPSCQEPEDLKVDQKFQLILVNSLFSHLNYDHWLRWLDRLYNLLEPNGYLVFSSHGFFCFKKRNDNIKKKMLKTRPDVGFMYWRGNETIGRLDTEIYGTTYVLKDWVKKVVKENNWGEVVNSFHPMFGFMGGQDIYVIQKPGK